MAAIPKKNTRKNGELNYLVVGAGGCGASIGAFLASAGKRVQFIARGAHLTAMKNDGLWLETTRRGSFRVKPVAAYDEKEYVEGLRSGEYPKPDVIFICVKYYSLEPLIPFLQTVSDERTVIIPILNVYGTGQKLQERLPSCLVPDGCMYIAAEIREPGCIIQKGDIFKVVFGVVDAGRQRPILKTVQEELQNSGIDAVLSENIRRDALVKFSLISPMAACGIFYNVRVGAMQIPGEPRQTFIKLVQEIAALGAAMGIALPEDLVRRNLELIDALLPDACASMQRDLWQGKESEMDGIILEVLRMAEKAGIRLPVYELVAGKLLS